MKERIQIAENLGKAAFLRGLSRHSSVLDSGLVSLCDSRLPLGTLSAIVNAWYSGWDQAAGRA